MLTSMCHVVDVFTSMCHVVGVLTSVCHVVGVLTSMCHVVAVFTSMCHVVGMTVDVHVSRGGCGCSDVHVSCGRFDWVWLC